MEISSGIQHLEFNFDMGLDDIIIFWESNWFCGKKLMLSYSIGFGIPCYSYCGMDFEQNFHLISIIKLDRCSVYRS